MFDVAVENMVSDCCTDVFKQQFADIDEIMDEFDYADYPQAMLDIAMTQDMYSGKAGVSDMIYQTTYRHLDYLLRRHEVILTEEATIADQILILRSLQLLQSCECHGDVVAITDSDLDYIEQFISLMQLVTVVEQPTTLMTKIESVQHSLIEAIYRLHKGKEDQEQSLASPEHLAELKKLYIYYKEVLHKDSANIWAIKILQAGVNLGSEFNYYYKLVQPRIDAIVDPSQLAEQLFMLFMMGSDSWQSILPYWRSHNEQIVTDMELLTKVDMHLAEKIAKYERYKFTKLDTRKAIA